MLTNNQVKTNKKQQPRWQVALTGLSLLLAALVLFGPLTGVALAKQNKVSICHLDDEGNYIPISVAEPALDAHLGHGDLVVGVDVDENCEPLVPDADGDGVADAEDNCVNVANPDQLNRYGTVAGDTCEDLDGDGTADVNEANFCLSIDGVLLESRGTAVCNSTASTDPATGPNVAVANGDEAEAYAAVFSNGDPLPGANNSAMAVGDSAEATAASGSNNSATAIGVNALAGSGGGNNNSATAIGVNALAGVGNGNNNSATANGDGASAESTFGDNNNATSTGVYTCAGGTAPFDLQNGETALNENLCTN